MTRHFLIAILASLMLASCTQHSSRERAAEITKLETDLKQSAQNKTADTAILSKLMSHYAVYANTYPDDSLAPVYLMKLAKFHDAILHPDSAIVYYDRVYRSYPAYPKASIALFSEAFIYNNEKHDLPKAQALYNEYLSKYANTPLAKSAAIELRNLGKTPEQILAEMDSTRQLMKARAAAKN